MVYNLPNNIQRPSPEPISFTLLYINVYVIFRYKQICSLTVSAKRIFYLYLFCGDCQLRDFRIFPEKGKLCKGPFNDYIHVLFGFDTVSSI